MIASSISGNAAVPMGGRKLRVVVFTVVFPNHIQPLHGTFVRERVLRLGELNDVRVVAPIAWYRSLMARSPRTEVVHWLKVYHPKFWYLPGTVSALRGVFLAISAYRTFRRLRSEFDFDLIDAHFAYPDGFAAILLGRLFRRPVCMTLRGTSVPQSRTRLGRWLCDWAIRRADRVITVSENLAERARQSGFPAEKIRTIPNGVDSERFQIMDQSSARELLGLRRDARLVICVGHLSPRKGFQRVIRSLPGIIDAHPDVLLAIIGGKGGEVDNGAELRALAAELGHEERVLFAGAEPPERVALWFGAAELFIHASDFEGCPNVVLEAMACGRSIVATKVGDTARMVPAFAGLLVDDPDDSRALTEAACKALSRDWSPDDIRNHVLSRSWEAVAVEVDRQWRLSLGAFSQEISTETRGDDEPRVAPTR